MRRVTVSTSDASGGAKSSNTIPINIDGWPQIALQVVVTGTVSYTIQQTLDDPYGTASLVWFDHPDTNVVAATANKQANYAYPPAAVKLLQNSGSGSCVMTLIQAGLVGN